MDNCVLLNAENGLKDMSGAPLKYGMDEHTPLPARSSSHHDALKVFDEIPQRSSATMKASTWADLVKNNSNVSYGAKLEHIPSSNGAVTLEDEDRIDLEKKWGYGMVGMFAGRFPGIAPLRAMCDAKFQVPFELYPNVNGWILFKFPTEEDRQKVLPG